MPLLVSRVGDAYDRHCAYVYLLASRIHGAVYVGETNDAGGALGRAGSHLRPDGTFTKRFEDRIGLAAEDATDLTLVSARLPLVPEFTGVEKSYRQGAEYLVQAGLYAHPVRRAHPFLLIAEVTAGAARASVTGVQRLATEIVDGFAALYPTLA